MLPDGMHHFISLSDFTKDQIVELVGSIAEFEKLERYRGLMEGKIMIPNFREPSTRTMLSFQKAMLDMGGMISPCPDGTRTSCAKGETYRDEVTMMQHYGDVIVMRTPVEGAPRLASEYSSVPIINAGDGANEHPTQTFLDLYTILKEKGRLEDLRIGFLNDLKYSRTVHSLVRALGLLGNWFYFISPPELAIGDQYLKFLRKNDQSYYTTADLEEFIADLDILYVTRLQKERFPDETEYEKYKGIYKVTIDLLTHAKPTLRIMHPLPRVREISTKVDATQFALYEQQAANGVPARRMILAYAMGVM